MPTPRGSSCTRGHGAVFLPRGDIGGGDSLTTLAVSPLPLTTMGSTAQPCCHQAPLAARPLPWQCQPPGEQQRQQWGWSWALWAPVAVPRAWQSQELSLGFQHPMGCAGSGGPSVGGRDASSPGSPLPWLGSPWKPTVPAAPSWERGSSGPGPAAAVPLSFIYIPAKEPATTAATSSRGPWLRSWVLSPCPQPCRSARSRPRQRDSHCRSWPRAWVPALRDRCP